LKVAAGGSPPVEIRFGDGRRPEEATHVRLETFDGPLALLLSLIEARQLDVLHVRLGDLAGAYLEALARLDTDRLPMLSAFVSVCSQLIAIKSRALLPRPAIEAAAEAEDGEDPEEELRQRLVLYRRYRDAGRLLADRLAAGGSFRREPAAAIAAGLAGARPPGEPLEAALLVRALAVPVKLAPPPPPPPQVMRRVITLDERAAAIRAALRHAPLVVLQDLLSGVTDRVVVAVTFMALLEMAKGRELSIEQRAPWGPIQVRAHPS
jgi:segregation and condensation protein A